MEIEFSNRFRHRYKKKAPDQRRLVQDTLEMMATNLRHPGLRTHKVQGTRGVFEAYANDAIRVTFQYGTRGRIIVRNNCLHDAVLKFP